MTNPTLTEKDVAEIAGLTRRTPTLESAFRTAVHLIRTQAHAYRNDLAGSAHRVSRQALVAKLDAEAQLIEQHLDHLISTPNMPKGDRA